MRKILAMLLLMAMLHGAAALAEGPVLLVNLPDDAQMIENVQFEDGDYIQTYQLADGVTAQLLRYASFGMTLEDMAQGEWTGYDEAQLLDMEQVGACPAQAMRLTYQQQTEEGAKSVVVYILLVHAQDQTLIFEAVFPAELGETRIENDANAWLSTMEVYGTDMQEVG